jgi:hypothetical protein
VNSKDRQELEGILLGSIASDSLFSQSPMRVEKEDLSQTPTSNNLISSLVLQGGELEGESPCWLACAWASSCSTGSLHSKVSPQIYVAVLRDGELQKPHSPDSKKIISF